MNKAAAGIVASPLLYKLDRLRRGEPARALDLFAGAGGISLGFHRAGFEMRGAVEIDPLAALTHAKNFHGHLEADKFRAHAQPRDMRMDPAALAEELELGDVERAIDVLVGGPPCQAYARVGRAKLREVADHPEAFRVDPRGNLYLRYLAYVRAFCPLAVLIENVPDILHYGHHNVAEEIVEALDDLGYTARYSLINSAFHGVPQMRDRVYLIAYRRELGLDIRFPKATNHLKLPPGYAGTRAVALRYVDRQGVSGYVSPDLGHDGLAAPVSAEDAIGDLAPISGRSVKRGTRRFDKLSVYREDRQPSAYAINMRNWAGFESDEGVWDHVIRYLPRDHLTFAEMRPGAEYPEAHATAAKIVDRVASERGVRQGTQAFNELWNSIVPPYDVTKFPNRWWKLRPEFPVRTLMAHIGKDTYSHIHYDAAQARTISVREAARLQSFPDGFAFSGTMNPAFRQIGNAVPPMMSFALAEVIHEDLRTAANARTETQLLQRRG
ncbi:DNA (cytosine-5)-methyltransferase 1 [Rhizobium leguminosarum]|uniref:DNA (cytosine-5-)-methyltransferase n=1 Tax=Rhizobium leguminosarum TaxID=384 RepID=A0AAE2MQ38_RHILE|nr:MULTISPECIES: DNA cytosine methyltransferase [Rhizobium]MBB4293289.1 DNA (cytosine-5)-methyltransferase 1 [Rhizobium leguminosarum]MBB4296102.1 DNA (cytosine-5)-methyltransferase 1 [Rhizobium leguminosarum]MBB4311449.1 DNA (cytosine-5)-methyltransferase 1 [Rhizobium leguminosarum]MBB4420331.1 DNA (cytosine-5)-methyltransferase 1 [Rhizobium leguminosarum]MBB4435514.1 DNA (cytosine-5)-methyltransferase 1 [Rhizobium esperanzae]